MILILSQAGNEATTEIVMDWLDHFGARFVRVNGQDLGETSSASLTIESNYVRLRFGDEASAFALADVSVVWFRRWAQERAHHALDLFRGDLKLEGADKLYGSVVNHLDLELGKLSGFFFSLLDGKTWLSHPLTASPNKLKVLQEAMRAGLDIPATLVTTSRDELTSFARNHGPLITKAIGEAEMFSVDGTVHMMYTARVDAIDIEGFPDHFFPSLFQEALEKSYEIRVFYLDGHCDSMAIFSQLDRQTQIDFRQYNREKPNRYVPYRLPTDVSDAIVRLMQRLDLETGSLDLVRTTDGRHVFLEVNPVGQFGMVSHPCNYHLERKVAEWLINHDGDAEA